MYEWDAEIICSLEATCGASWGWRGCVRTWRVRSLNDFGAVSRRFIGRSTRKTSWGTGIIFIHAYLHQWTIVSHDGFLNVEIQNLEVSKFLKYDGISWFFDGELIYDHYLRYSQSFIDYLIEFVKIEKFGGETDFSKFGFFWRELQIELLICSLGRIIISISENTFVIAHLYQKLNFSIFELYPHFFEIFHLLLFPAFLVNFNLGPLYKHYATYFKS